MREKTLQEKGIMEKLPIKIYKNSLKSSPTSYKKKGTHISIYIK